ncbi:HSP20-like chaperone [Mycena rosella]|uniref:HSP20-like chaperone n=1 Tax=Mycena rosella TaxID=1033263 RepID=A0AAD7GWI9_MYCRO|nr:HSP20-like chaperone [Mycena rosella]
MESTIMLDSESAHQRTTNAIRSRNMADLLDAVRTGRLRVVDRPLHNGPFCPRMEVYDDPDSLNILATFELPGVKVSDISISVKPEGLEIRGQRLSRCRGNHPRHPSAHGPSESQTSEMDGSIRSNNRFFPYRELRYGRFYRRLRLPSGANILCITAHLADGLLTVSVPRSPQAGPGMPGVAAGTADCRVRHNTSFVRSDPRGAVEDGSN